MAVAIANSGAAHTMWHGPTSPITSSAIDTTGAEHLYVSVACDTGSGTVTVTDSKGNTWQQLYLTNAGFSRLVTFEAINLLSVGAGHTFTISGGVFMRAQVTAFTGYVGSPAVDQHSSGTGTNSAHPGSITPTTTNQLIICSSGTDNSVGGVASIDSGLTIIDQGPEIGSDCYGLMVAYIVQTSIVTVNATVSWTVASATSATIVSFNDDTTPSQGEVTQTGIQTWSEGNPQGQLTQTGIEAWSEGNPIGKITQIGIQVWSMPSPAPSPTPPGPTVETIYFRRPEATNGHSVRSW